MEGRGCRCRSPGTYDVDPLARAKGARGTGRLQASADLRRRAWGHPAYGASAGDPSTSTGIDAVSSTAAAASSRSVVSGIDR